MIRTILLAAAALASVSFSPRHAEGAQAPWCAVINVGVGSIYWDCQYRSFETAIAEATFWRAIAVSVIRARTTSLDPRSKGRPGTVALARSSGATRHIVNVRY
jgi:dihydropteroate synthase